MSCPCTFGSSQPCTWVNLLRTDKLTGRLGQAGSTRESIRTRPETLRISSESSFHALSSPQVVAGSSSHLSSPSDCSRLPPIDEIWRPSRSATKGNLGLGNQDPRVHRPWDMLGESGKAGGCLSPSMGGRAQPREAPSRTAPSRAVYGSVWARGVMLCVSLVMGCVRWSFLTVYKPQKRQLDAVFIVRTPPTTACWDAATRTAVHVASAPP